jgi:glutamate-5-semialdehyde dehydrogenase
MSPAATPDVSDQLAAHVQDLCLRARPAARAVARMSDAARRRALMAAAEAIQADAATVAIANAMDLTQANREGLSAALVDRLRLDPKRLEPVIADLRAVANLPDPVNRVLETRTISQGVRCEKITVPIGVVAIIFESRPNVVVDAAALCLRSGNACILRGGKEAARTNLALANAFRKGLERVGMDPEVVQLVREPDRRLIDVLLQRDDAIDLVIPRGGQGLIDAVTKVSRIPVIRHDKGVCSLYVHEAADIDMALNLTVNAKCQKPGVCNAIENLVVDLAIAPNFLPRLAAEMSRQHVELRADDEAMNYLPNAQPATEEDWSTEYLALILSVKVVRDLDEAIAFTNRYGSHHSDAIVTRDTAAADRYLAEVDSACVYHNASTRFTDGGQFGFGAEIGISTNRLHARGPMGLNELTTYKYVLRGEGQVRA